MLVFWGNSKAEPFVTFPLYWLLNRNPYNGLLKSPHNWEAKILQKTLKQPGELQSWALKKWAFKALAELLLLGPTDENHHSTRVHHPWYRGPVKGVTKKHEKRGCRLGGEKNKRILVTCTKSCTIKCFLFIMIWLYLLLFIIIMIWIVFVSIIIICDLSETGQSLS